MRLGIVVSHPVQYYAPWYRELAKQVDLHVMFAQAASATQHAIGGYGKGFEWDTDLLGGFSSSILGNVAKRPNVHTFNGCDTPSVGAALRSHRFDAVLVSGWAFKCYLQALYECRRQGVPALVRGDSQLATPRGNLKRLVKQVAYPYLLKNYAACLYVGERNREYLRHYQVPAERLFHVPHAVDNRWFAQEARAALPQRSAIREAWGVLPHDAVALFVGRLVDFKRPLDLIRAAALVGAAGRRIHPVFVGTGGVEHALLSEARALGVTVTMAGFKNQSELPAVYAAADFLTLPSSGEETWGLVVNEAMACGIPAIVSESVGCAPDLIDAGLTGEVFPSGDARALAERIASFLPRLGTQTVSASLSAKMAKYSMEGAVEGMMSALRFVTQGAR